MPAFKQLHTFRCSNCGTMAVSAVWMADPPICCIVCHRYMRHLFGEPIETPEQQALYDRGVVWNPGTSKERGVNG